MAEFTQIKLDIDGHVATITLYRPEKMNAFTHTMRDEIIEAIDITDADDETFEDERVFVGGFRWGLTDAFSIVLSAQDYETLDTTEFRVGAAVNF